jgi:hypothetical protein
MCALNPRALETFNQRHQRVSIVSGGALDCARNLDERSLPQEKPNGASQQNKSGKQDYREKGQARCSRQLPLVIHESRHTERDERASDDTRASRNHLKESPPKRETAKRGAHTDTPWFLFDDELLNCCAHSLFRRCDSTLPHGDE